MLDILIIVVPHVKIQLKAFHAVLKQSQGHKEELSYGVTENRYTEDIKMNDLATPLNSYFSIEI